MPPLTVTLKDELSAVFPRTASSMTAEVSVMFRFAGGLQINDGVVTLQADSITRARPGTCASSSRRCSPLMRTSWW